MGEGSDANKGPFLADTEKNNSPHQPERFNLLSFYVSVRDLNASFWGKKSMRESVCGVKVTLFNELLTSDISKSLVLVAETKIWCFSFFPL